MNNLDLDTFIKTGSGFISLNISGLNQTLNSSATVTLEGVSCGGYVLYYSAGHFTSLAELLESGSKQVVATAGASTCTDTSICDTVSCSGSTLTFR